MKVYGLWNGSWWWRSRHGELFNTVHRGVAALEARKAHRSVIYDLDCTKIGTIGLDGKKIDHVHGVPHLAEWQVKIIGPDGRPIEEE